MKNTNQINKLQKLSLSLGAFIAGWAVAEVLERGYEQIFEEPAPGKPEADQAMPAMKIAAWTVISGLAVSAVKTFIQRKGGQRLSGAGQKS